MARASWKEGLLPCAFRDVPFHWRDTGLEGGRRLAVHEYPLRDAASTEDLGRRVRRYPMTGYVLGDDYFAQRAALEGALEAAGPGTLAHPYRGNLSVAVERFRCDEGQDEGRYARFDISFVEWGVPPAPRATADTVSGVLDASAGAQAALGTSFASRFSLAGIPGYLRTSPIGIVGSIETQFAGLSGKGGLGLAALAGDPAALGFAVIVAFSGYADAVAAILQVAALVADVETTSRGAAALGDPSFGLGAFAAFGATLPADAHPHAAANQTALIDLAQGAAAAALAMVYANTAFASSSDAGAARDQITAMIDAQILAADAAFDEALVLAWQQLYATTSSDLSARGRVLPGIVTFTGKRPMSSLALASRLYQDASRAPELVARNAAPHPGFMPLTIEALSQ